MFRIHQHDGCLSLRGSIRQHIDSLGSSPEAIAGRLGTYGVRGVPGKASDCVIARYLHAVIGGTEPVDRIAVYHGSVQIYRPGTLFPAVIRLSRAMSAFIRGFDLGGYPHLVEERTVPARGRRHGPIEDGRPAGTAAPG